MDPRVLAHFGGDLTRANISPTQAGEDPGPPRRRGVHGDDRALAGRRTEATAGRAQSSPAVAEEVLAARCPGCGYTYEVVRGDEREGFAAGTAWADVPDSWCCPDCGVREKVDFVPVESEHAS